MLRRRAVAELATPCEACGALPLRYHPRFQIPDSTLSEDSLSSLDPTASRPDSWLRFDQRILLLALAAGFPAALVALILLWTGDYTPKVQWTLTVFVIGVWTASPTIREMTPSETRPV